MAIYQRRKVKNCPASALGVCGGCAQLLSHVWFFKTPKTVAHQAPLSMGFPRQEYYNTIILFPTPDDLPDSGSNPRLLHKRVDSLPLLHLGSPIAGDPWSEPGTVVLSLWGPRRCPPAVGPGAGITVQSHTPAGSVNIISTNTQHIYRAGLKDIQLWRAGVELFVCYFHQDVTLCLKKEMATHTSILAWRINTMDRGTWRATVQGVAKSWTQWSAWAHMWGSDFWKS